MQPSGQRQLKAFSALTDMAGDNAATEKHFMNAYKYAGVAVTPYTPRLDASQFDSGQGFVTTFTGLNVIKVACNVSPGDMLIAVPPIDWAITNARHEDSLMRGKIVGARMWVMKIGEKSLYKNLSTEYKKMWTIGRCVGGALKVCFP